MTFRVSGNIENALSLGGGEGVGFTGIERICDLRFLQNQISKKLFSFCPTKFYLRCLFSIFISLRTLMLLIFGDFIHFRHQKAFFFVYVLQIASGEKSLKRIFLSQAK